MAYRYQTSMSYISWNDLKVCKDDLCVFELREVNYIIRNDICETMMLWKRSYVIFPWMIWKYERVVMMFALWSCYVLPIYLRYDLWDMCINFRLCQSIPFTSEIIWKCEWLLNNMKYKKFAIFFKDTYKGNETSFLNKCSIKSSCYEKYVMSIIPITLWLYELWDMKCFYEYQLSMLGTNFMK